MGNDDLDQGSTTTNEESVDSKPAEDTGATSSDDNTGGDVHGEDGGAPRIKSFTGKDSGPDDDLDHSLQVTKGSTVTLRWTLEGGEPAELAVDGAEAEVDLKATELAVTPQQSTDYTLRVKNSQGDDSQTVHVAVNEEHEIVSPHSTVTPGDDDVLCDPPVRLLPQWDGRWGNDQIGGTERAPKDLPKGLHWYYSGCCPSTMAMVLRWFAEDNKDSKGKLRFPEKDGTSLAADFYSQRMCEAYWPTLLGKPNDKGRCGLNSSGAIDKAALMQKTAQQLGMDKAQTLRRPASGSDWVATLKSMLKNGPVAFNYTEPRGHFVILQGIQGGKFLFVDPGNVFYSDLRKGSGFEQGVGMPPAENWSGGVPGNERDPRAYVSLEGAALEKVLQKILVVQSFAWSGAAAEEAPAPEPEAPRAEEPEQPKAEEPEQPQAAAPDRIRDGGFTLGGQGFAEWFNATLKGKGDFKKGSVDDAQFRKVFDCAKGFQADGLTLPQFAGLFSLMYNEVGPGLKPSTEKGGPRYCFEEWRRGYKYPEGGKKRSYNGGSNRRAGDLLVARNQIDESQRELWNGTVWPETEPDAELTAALRECDFYKYRGRGFIQTTGRENYLRTVDPALKAQGLKTCEELTNDELDQIVETNMTVALAMVRNFFSGGRRGDALAAVDGDPPVWWRLGSVVAGSDSYGKGTFNSRCQALYQAMKDAGWGGGAAAQPE
jgi:hypothetical protein